MPCQYVTLSAKQISISLQLEWTNEQRDDGTWQCQEVQHLLQMVEMKKIGTVLCKIK